MTDDDTTPPIVRLAVAYGDAWNRADTHAILGLHTADSVFQMHDGSPPAIGIEAIGTALGEFFDQWSDAKFVRRNVFFGKDNWAAEWTLTARSRVGGDDGAAGVVVTCEGVDIVTVRDGLVAAKHVYYDRLTAMRMLEAGRVA